jgi:hypothetical protein
MSRTFFDGIQYSTLNIYCDLLNNTLNTVATSEKFSEFCYNYRLKRPQEYYISKSPAQLCCLLGLRRCPVDQLYAIFLRQTV